MFKYRQSSDILEESSEDHPFDGCIHNGGYCVPLIVSPPGLTVYLAGGFHLNELIGGAANGIERYSWQLDVDLP
tara:strand:- start:80 stop:301 length:222 start_codon:yes stop_codon:yes gene_type:complete